MTFSMEKTKFEYEKVKKQMKLGYWYVPDDETLLKLI